MDGPQGGVLGAKWVRVRRRRGDSCRVLRAMLCRFPPTHLGVTREGVGDGALLAAPMRGDLSAGGDHMAGWALPGLMGLFPGGAPQWVGSGD